MKMNKINKGGRNLHQRHDELVQAVLNLCAVYGIYARAIDPGPLRFRQRRFGEKGEWDVQGVFGYRWKTLAGWPLAVEIKTGNGKMSPPQRAWGEKKKMEGWRLYVVRDTIDELETELKRLCIIDEVPDNPVIKEE